MVTDSTQPDPPAPPSLPAGPPTILGRLLGAALAVLVLAGGAGVAFYWLTHRPKAQRRPPPAQATLVEAEPVALRPHRVTVSAMGTVVPARQMQLASRVGGEIVHVAAGFVPGGRYAAGEVLVRIDPKDYELAVRQQQTEVLKRAAEAEQRAAEIVQRQADVTRAEADLALEMGQQSVAKREFELLGKTLKPEDSALVLRVPQLQTAEANCAAARAAVVSAEGAAKAAAATKAAAEVALERAQLDLDRTTVKAPFNAVVQSRDIHLGSQVSAGTPLATLAGADEYWVEVSVPVDHLKWLRIPGFNDTEGSAVRVYHEPAWGPGAYREGTVKRLLTDLEPQGRMARLLVSVADPLTLTGSTGGGRALILGAYVRVEIAGPDLKQVARVPRTALRDGKRVWVMKPDKTLDIRDVTIAWSTDDHVYVSGGLSAGERLIRSDLGAPVSGMALRTAEDAPASSRPGADSRPAPGGPEEGRP